MGFPLLQPLDDPSPKDGVRGGTLPGGRVARSIHQGGFDGLGASWATLMAWVQTNGHLPAGGFWEVYLVEPTPDMDPAELRTELNLPIR